MSKYVIDALVEYGKLEPESNKLPRPTEKEILDDSFWKKQIEFAKRHGVEKQFLTVVSGAQWYTQLKPSVQNQIELLLEDAAVDEGCFEDELHRLATCFSKNLINAILINEIPSFGPLVFSQLNFLIPKEEFLQGLHVLGKIGYRQIASDRFDGKQMLLKRKGGSVSIFLRSNFAHQSIDSAALTSIQKNIFSRSNQMPFRNLSSSVRYLTAEDFMIYQLIQSMRQSQSVNLLNLLEMHVCIAKSAKFDWDRLSKDLEKLQIYSKSVMQVHLMKEVLHTQLSQNTLNALMKKSGWMQGVLVGPFKLKKAKDQLKAS